MKRIARWSLLFLIVVAGSPQLHAADHADGTTTAGPALALEPAADVNDLFAWMSASATQVNLVMSVFPGATTASRFSDAVKYVFHTSSVSAYLGTAVSRDIICTFSSDATQVASCWLTDPSDTTAGSIKEYVTGNASGTTGVVTTDFRFRVFAGPRADPFFFNLAGFRNATATVAAAVRDATVNPTAPTYIKGFDTGGHPGCPLLSATARTVVTGYLNKDCTGVGTAVDFFKKPITADNAGCTVKPALVNTQQTQNAGLTGNILAITVQVDKTLLTTGGPILNVWAATTK
jgi:hypothetical protein